MRPTILPQVLVSLVDDVVNTWKNKFMVNYGVSTKLLTCQICEKVLRLFDYCMIVVKVS